MDAYLNEGKDYHEFVAPTGWEFKGSLSDDYIAVPVDCHKAEIMKNDLGLKKIYDRIQGQVIYSTDI